MVIQKKIKKINAGWEIFKCLEDSNIDCDELDYLIGLFEYEQKVILESIAFGDYEYFGPSYFHFEDYVLVIQNYYELEKALEILNVYYEQMTNDNLKGGD